MALTQEQARELGAAIEHRRRSLIQELREDVAETCVQRP